MVVGMLTTALLVVVSIVGALWGLRFVVALARDRTASEAFDTSNRWLSMVGGGVAALLSGLLIYGAEILDVGTQLIAGNAMAFTNAIIGALGAGGIAGWIDVSWVMYVGAAVVVIVAVVFIREARTDSSGRVR